jgi:hypothetical protein
MFCCMYNVVTAWYALTCIQPGSETLGCTLVRRVMKLASMHVFRGW